MAEYRAIKIEKGSGGFGGPLIKTYFFSEK